MQYLKKVKCNIHIHIHIYICIYKFLIECFLLGVRQETGNMTFMCLQIHAILEAANKNLILGYKKYACYDAEYWQKLRQSIE